MESDFAILRDCPLFVGIDQEQLRTMLECMGARRVRTGRGEPIFMEGDRAESVGVVISGAAQVVRHDIFGNRTIQMRVGPGGLFGETFACAGVTRLPVSVEAALPGEILLIDLRRVMGTCPNACGFHRRMVTNLLRVLAEKNLRLNDKLDIAARRTTRDKLMAYLMTQAKAAGGPAFEIPFDRQGLADYLGVERSALSAEIGRLRREGVLESRRSTFRLLTKEEGE